MDPTLQTARFLAPAREEQRREAGREDPHQELGPVESRISTAGQCHNEAKHGDNDSENTSQYPLTEENAMDSVIVFARSQ